MFEHHTHPLLPLAQYLGRLALSILVGTLTAFAFSQSSLIRRALYPYAVLLQTIPIIAIAPIVIVSFGRGFLSITLVAGVISLFPIITSTTTGLLQIDPNLVDLFRLNKATRLRCCSGFESRRRCLTCCRGSVSRVGPRLSGRSWGSFLSDRASRDWEQ